MDEKKSEDSQNMNMVEVTASEDSLTGYIKLIKGDEDQEPITKELLAESLQINHILYGIKETSMEQLANRPIYNIKIEIAKGLEPIDGEDGRINYFVKRDSEYKPEFNVEGSVDYKNVDYFQFVKKGQVLCEIIKGEKGIDGVNIFGGVIPGRDGRYPASPLGKNTEYVEDDTKLVASCDGVVKFFTDAINIVEALHIKENVDQLSGNIDFSGEVTIDGDICSGYSASSGGDMTVRGVIENAAVKVGGNLSIGKGINWVDQGSVFVGGDLKSKYIEDAVVHVEGDITVDYIIDSKITCMGNIELKGSKELIVGGDIKVLGELKAKSIGNENGINTKIEILGVETQDTEQLNKLKGARDEHQGKLDVLLENEKKLSGFDQLRANPDLMEQLTLIRRHIATLTSEIEYANRNIQKVESQWTLDYKGYVSCKGKLHQGVKVYFGETRFYFNGEHLDHCRIYWDNGEIKQGTL